METNRPEDIKLYVISKTINDNIYDNGIYTTFDYAKDKVDSLSEEDRKTSTIIELGLFGRGEDYMEFIKINEWSPDEAIRLVTEGE